MGCYDTVLIPCPTCDKEHYAKSKSGPCNLDTFEMDEAPAEVLIDVNRQAPFTCECGTKFHCVVKLIAMAKTAVWTPKDDDDY